MDLNDEDEASKTVSFPTKNRAKQPPANCKIKQTKNTLDSQIKFLNVGRRRHNLDVILLIFPAVDRLYLFIGRFWEQSKANT